MSVPTLVTCIATFILFLAVFRKQIYSVSFDNTKSLKKSVPVSSEQKKMIFVCTVIFLGFAAQTFYKFSASAIMLFGICMGIFWEL